MKFKTLLIILLIANCAFSQNLVRNDSVYKVVLSFMKDSLYKDSSEWLLLDSTSTDRGFFKCNNKEYWAHFNSPQEALTFCNDFYPVTALLKSEFPSAKKYKLLATKERNLFFADVGWDYKKSWDRFYKKYKKYNGYYSVSTIKYGNDGKTAMLAVNHYCGTLCGSGYILLLKKINENWKIVFYKSTWVA